VRHPFFNLEQCWKRGVIRNDSYYLNVGWSTGGVKGFLAIPQWIATFRARGSTIGLLRVFFFNLNQAAGRGCADLEEEA